MSASARSGHRTPGEWPTLQFVGTSIWQDLEVEPRGVHFSLSRSALDWPVVDRGRGCELRDPTRVGLSLRGLTCLHDGTADIGLFVQSVRHIAKRAAVGGGSGQLVRSRAKSIRHRRGADRAPADNDAARALEVGRRSSVKRRSHRNARGNGCIPCLHGRVV